MLILGDYICEHCGFHRPPDLCRIGPPLFNPSITRIQGQDYHTNIGGPFANIYNALAASLLLDSFGVQPEVIADLIAVAEAAHENEGCNPDKSR